jgi:hypothetical protein
MLDECMHAFVKGVPLSCITIIPDAADAMVYESSAERLGGCYPRIVRPTSAGYSSTM